MALTLSTSNCYVTDLDDTDDFFDAQITAVQAGVWEDATDEEKKAALIEATRIMERLNWAGSKADEDQDLQFPRGDDTTVPDDIQHACVDREAG